MSLAGLNLARLGTALAALALIAAAADPADRLADPGQEARARAIFQDVRCVVCQNQSIDDSEADVARDLRQAVRREVAAGHSDRQVRDYLVQRYGEFILLKPRFSLGNAFLWLGPFLIALIGLAALAIRARQPPRTESDLTAEEELGLRALREPLDAFALLRLSCVLQLAVRASESRMDTIGEANVRQLHYIAWRPVMVVRGRIKDRTGTWLPRRRD